jgi:hypothetical protein
MDFVAGTASACSLGRRLPVLSVSTSFDLTSSSSCSPRSSAACRTASLLPLSRYTLLQLLIPSCMNCRMLSSSTSPLRRFCCMLSSSAAAFTCDLTAPSRTATSSAADHRRAPLSFPPATIFFSKNPTSIHIHFVQRANNKTCSKNGERSPKLAQMVKVAAVAFTTNSGT